MCVSGVCTNQIFIIKSYNEMYNFALENFYFFRCFCCTHVMSVQHSPKLSKETTSIQSAVDNHNNDDGMIIEIDDAPLPPTSNTTANVSNVGLLQPSKLNIGMRSSLSDSSLPGNFTGLNFTFTLPSDLITTNRITRSQSASVNSLDTSQTKKRKHKNSNTSMDSVFEEFATLFSALQRPNRFAYYFC